MWHRPVNSDEVPAYGWWVGFSIWVVMALVAIAMGLIIIRPIPVGDEYDLGDHSIKYDPAIKETGRTRMEVDE